MTSMRIWSPPDARRTPDDEVQARDVDCVVSLHEAEQDDRDRSVPNEVCVLEAADDSPLSAAWCEGGTRAGTMSDELKDGEIRFRPRGLGNNWHPCFICGHKPLHACQFDMAGFVDPDLVRHVGDATFHPLSKLCHEVGVLGVLDYRASEPRRVQFKFGACGEHKPNLSLLEHMTYEDGKITKARLEACIPGRKTP